MENILSKNSSIEESNQLVEEEKRTKEEEKSSDIYSLIDKAYYIDELHYKIST
jgi:vacuolar-type H+-ATPase catalytic subunit A/Vma1